MTSRTIRFSTPIHCSQWIKSGKTQKKILFHIKLLLWTTIFLLQLLHYRLFLHTDRVTEQLKVYLNASCVESLCVQLKGYDTVRDHLKTYVAQPGVKVWIGTEYTNYALYELIKPTVCTFFYLTNFALFHMLLSCVHTRYSSVYTAVMLSRPNKCQTYNVSPCSTAPIWP